MPIVTGKCTECGASLNVDNNQKQGICQYCNTPFVIEDAINNFNTTNHITADVVNVYGEQKNNKQAIAARNHWMDKVWNLKDECTEFGRYVKDPEAGSRKIAQLKEAMGNDSELEHEDFKYLRDELNEIYTAMFNEHKQFKQSTSAAPRPSPQANNSGCGCLSTLLTLGIFISFVTIIITMVL